MPKITFIVSLIFKVFRRFYFSKVLHDATYDATLGNASKSTKIYLDEKMC